MTHYRKDKLNKWFIFSALFFATIALLIWAYWSLYPYKTIIHNPDRYTLDKDVLVQGEWTSYEFDYCKFIDKPATVTKRFIDGLVYDAPAIGLNLKKGCGHAKVPMQIPANLPPGSYMLEITATYQVNPIREVSEINTTEVFVVMRTAEGAYGDKSNEYIQPTK
jgi:hypothetical protein